MLTKSSSFREVALISFLFIALSMAAAWGNDGSLPANTEAGLSSEYTQDPVQAKQELIDFNTLIALNTASQNELNLKILEQTKGVQEAFDFEKKYRPERQSDRIRRTAEHVQIVLRPTR